MDKSAKKFMQEAIRLSREGMLANHGGPFGCVIVKNEEIIGSGCNQVLLNLDPTAHAEVVAIRNACARLGHYQLAGCELYTTCEPCPMCMGAIYWARPDRVYYANTRHDAARIGFDDSFIYEELITAMDDRKIAMFTVGREDAIRVFEEWQQKQDKSLY